MDFDGNPYKSPGKLEGGSMGLHVRSGECVEASILPPRAYQPSVAGVGFRFRAGV